MSSTNRWVRCSLGHDHWGSAGAAGLLLAHVDAAGGTWVLLQHRAAWVHLGDTWSVPGGALHEDEPAVDGALREVVEEAGIDLRGVAAVLDTYVDDHGGWAYTTVLATAEAMFDPDVADDAAGGPSNDPAWALPRERLEQERLAWWRSGEVGGLRLHPGFAATWPLVSKLLDALVAGPRG